MVETWKRMQSQHWDLSRVSIWISLFVVVLLFSACGKPAPRQAHIEGIQARSQERLFHSAKAEFLAARYASAIQAFLRFSSAYPRSSFQSEVRWLLARSYHELGDAKQALIQYQQVLDKPQAKSHHQDARKHIASLQPSLPSRIVHQGEVFALQMTFGQWEKGQMWAARLKNMARRGVTTQLINLECGLTKKDATLLFAPSSRHGAPNSKAIGGFRSFVQQAHKEGVSVFLGVNLRCLGQLNATANNGWADRAYDQPTQRFRSTRYFDIFNTDYQAFLGKILSQLGKTGIDGIVFLGDAPMGIFDGVTPVALAKFQQKFGRIFHPQKVFALNKIDREQTLASSRRAVSLPKDPGFWRWVGWRARARLGVLEGLMQTVKASYSEIQVSLEVSARGLSDPLQTLVLSSEDILESAHGEFSFLLIDLAQPRSSMPLASHLNGQSSQALIPRVAKRLLEITKDPTKIWLTIPRKVEAQTWSSGSLKDLTRDKNLPQGIGVVYDLRPFS